MENTPVGLLECSALDKRKNHTLRAYIKKLEFKNHILRVQQELSLDGILVVDDEWNMVTFNQRFIEMWEIPEHIVQCRDDKKSIRFVLDKLKYPDQFMARVEDLMANPEEKSRDEIELLDGRFFDRYSSPVLDKEKNIRGRVWFFRDITEVKESRALLKQQNTMLEEQVRHRTAELQHLNQTLTTLLHSLEKEKKALEDRVRVNIREALLPFFLTLKETSLSKRQRSLLQMIDYVLSDLLSSMNSSLQNLQYPLTPTETKVVNCIKTGQTSKEIALLLGCSERTVEGHRSAIRRKLGLKKGENLFLRLRSIS